VEREYIDGGLVTGREIVGYVGEREERIRREEMQQKTRRKEKRRTKQNKSYSTHVSSP